MISRRSSRGKIHSTRWSCPINVKIHARKRKGETTGNTNFDLHRRASPRPTLRDGLGLSHLIPPLN